MTPLLLDTHTFLWLKAEPGRLSNDTLALLSDPSTELYLSAASAWEIAIKFRLGKLTLPFEPERYVPNAMMESGIVTLPIEQAHALRVAHLPLHHNDPFDRLLVAQAQIANLTIVTSDPKVLQYDVSCLTAE